MYKSGVNRNTPRTAITICYTLLQARASFSLFSKGKAMEALWVSVAVLVVSVLSGAITAGIVMAIGGLGVIRGLQRSVSLTEERIEDVNSRITTEVKKRAAGMAVEAKARGKSVQQEVDAALSHGPDSPAAAGGRKKPSVVSIRR